MKKHSDQRRQSKDQAEAHTKQQQPRREEQYRNINRSEEQIFQLMVQSVCDTKRDS